ncbi:MAG: leucine-rich repeat protein [Ruminococcus sp.]|uniref:leucine-rich repeat protein n=1 Tax=Ruminococcus sp. TaxID=41978 RepID=UPI0025FCCFB2|nr:leucine-rich repeat protein [Ruminococcus sp.]MBR6996949.1 leucine-rich repeat protein [Ruminococcus sp.]
MKKRVISAAVSLAMGVTYSASLSVSLNAGAKSVFDFSGEHTECADEAWRWLNFGDHIVINEYHGDKTRVEIPDTIEELPVTAVTDETFFWVDDPVEYVRIPAAVTDIGMALSYCRALDTVEIDPANKNYVYEDGAVYTADRTDLVRCLPSRTKGDVIVPDTVDFIVSGAFDNCQELTSVTIPASVEWIASDLFNNCGSLKSINVAEGNKEYSDIDGILYNAQKNVLCRYPAGRGDKSFIIPDTVEVVRDYAFQNCDNLETIQLSKMAESINYSTFEGCDKLDHVVIPDNIVRVESYAFENCSSLSDITFSDNTREYGGNVFYGTPWWDGQKDGPVYCGNYLYKIKGKLPSNSTIVVKEGTKGIGEYAFCTEENKYGYGVGGDKNLVKVVLPEGLEYIGQEAFFDCRNLTEINLPDSVNRLANSAFTCCTSLKSIHIPTSLTAIEASVFSSCSSLEEVDLPENITQIDYEAFFGCESLRSITINNPFCEIYDSYDTICNIVDYDNGNIDFSGTIYGYEGSTAQAYAELYIYNFRSPEGFAVTKGDTDGSGAVDAVDASAVLSYYALISTDHDGGFSPRQKLAADVDHDGSVNAVDASSILSYYAYVSTAEEEIMTMDEFLKKAD